MLLFKWDTNRTDRTDKNFIKKILLLTFSVVTSVIGVRPAINRRANELRRMNPA
jgi:hypothetical protein